jgi:hypothetical protein
MAASRRPRVHRGLRGSSEPPPARRLLLGEVRRALEGHRRGGMGAAADGLHPRVLELAGQRLVGAVGHDGAVPGPADRVLNGRRRAPRGPRGARCASPSGRRPSARGGAEGHAAVDAHEARALGLVEVRERSPSASAALWTVAEVADVVGRGQQQHAPRGVGQLGHPRSEGGLDRAAHGRRADDRLDAVELGVGERRRKLQQRERVAVGRLQQARDHVGRHRAAQAGAEESLGVGLVEAADLELDESGCVELARVAGARGHQERDGLGLEAARGEHERFGRRRIEPLGVVHATQDRAALAGLGQQAEQARRDQEAVADGVEAQPQRAAQRGGLRIGQALDEVRHGRTSWCMPAKGSSCSASIPTQRSTVMSRALSAAYSSRAVLPMPGSPRSTSAALRSSRALCSSASRADRSDSRPTSISWRS